VDRLIYILDTNVVIDYLRDSPSVKQNFYRVLAENHRVYLCQPVYYEIVRGFIRNKSIRKRTIFEEKFMPMLSWLPLIDEDWKQTAQFWADAINQGWQLSDMDLLIASVVKRFDAILVSADNDFNVLPIVRENWRVNPN
jgi:predicted nucleic acid-binding protein